jgi:hypothetical protein
VADCLAAGHAPPEAVVDDAGEDDDHADEPRQMRGILGRGVLVQMSDVVGGLEVGHDVAKPGKHHDGESDSYEEWRREELPARGL